MWLLFWWHLLILYCNFYTDAIIEELALSPDGQIMVLGDSSGRLHILDTESSQVIFSHVCTHFWTTYMCIYIYTHLPCMFTFLKYINQYKPIWKGFYDIIHRKNKLSPTLLCLLKASDPMILCVMFEKIKYLFIMTLPNLCQHLIVRPCTAFVELNVLQW